MSKTTYDTVVIGGGVSGLTCALLQARKGRRVVLVEKAPHLSPTLWGFERFGTYFDTGFHYAGSVGEDGLLSHLVHQLGLDGQLPTDIRPDVYDRVRFQTAGYDVPFHQGWDALEVGLAEVYPGDRVGIHDDFFELGGTSLAAMEVMIRLCREFDIDLPLETMFSHPTLGELAKLAEERILADVAEVSEADRQ